MRIHFVFQPDSAERFRTLGLLAERLGFEAVWTANLLSARSPYVAMSLLARESRTLRFGPVAVSPFEEHPLKIANSLLALNELAGGRANIVIGGGGGTLIGMGLKPARTSVYPRMVRGVRECVEFLRQVSPGRALDYEGSVFQIHGYQPTWATATPPQIYIAASKPQMLRLAGRIADGVMLSDLTLAALPAALAEITRGAAANPAPAQRPLINNLLAWHVKPDRAAAYVEARRHLWVRGIWERARLEPWLSPADCEVVMRSLPAWQKAYSEGSPVIPGVTERIVNSLVDGLTLTGNYAAVDRLIGKLRAYQDAGVDEVSLRLYDEPESSIRLVAEHIVPALR
jgi:alkanesulfonate monooxygenase SsuD/methylene tetrahydromethanopterin reductase-like flavin-dependent oxidoreductase (luciferase family)